MTSITDFRFSRWEMLSCNASKIVSSAMTSCWKHRTNKSQLSNETENTSFLDATGPALTAINPEEYRCTAPVKTADVKDMLNYMCDVCPPSIEPHVEAAWTYGVCQAPANTGFNIAVFCFYVAVLLAAIVGNTLVVFVVGGTAKMRTVTNYFILNLAVGDLLMAIFCIPFTFATTVILQYWPFGAEMCIAVNYLQVGVNLMNVIIIVSYLICISSYTFLTSIKLKLFAMNIASSSFLLS
ncbi:G protein-coupled receptor rhodopsin-like [Trinorchestia longiramus]|nr:G protein-coupled receptor rhodopsin-like [Trinorchestia longiramus]